MERLPRAPDGAVLSGYRCVAPPPVPRTHGAVEGRRGRAGVGGIGGILRRRLYTYLWSGEGLPPFPYVMLVLCRDVYHAPPDVVSRLPAGMVLEHLACLEVEDRVKRAKHGG
jgi:hypothetical protein